jgi:hypothetical protein
VRAARRARRLVVPLVALLALLGGLLAPAGPSPAEAQVAAASVRAGIPAPQPPVPGARHFHEVLGEAGPGYGYDVREPFAGAVEALGGVYVTGYPASAPFQGTDTCVYQLFQVLALQACPDVPVRPANTFEMLADAGADADLASLGIGAGEPDGATSFDEAMRIRLGWLEDEAIADRYLSQCGAGSAVAAIERCGLPMNRPQLFGPFVSQRFQRIAFQRWIDSGPGGIQPGDVTAVLGGDLLKVLRVVSGPAVEPHRAGQPPPLQLAPSARTAIGGVGRRPSPPEIGLPLPFAPAPPAVPIVPLVQAAKAGFGDQATLSVIRPGVEIARSGQPGWFRPARTGDDLFSGDIVRTDARGHALVTFYEGTTAEVLPGSELVVERLDLGPGRPAQVSIWQIAGQVVHRLVRALAPGATYQVRTPSAVAVVRGTVLRMTVADDGKTEVEVFRGKVDVQARGTTVAVAADTRTEVAPGLAPSAPAPNVAPPPLLVEPKVPIVVPTPVPTALPTHTPARTVVPTWTATATPLEAPTSTPHATPTTLYAQIGLPTPAPTALPPERTPAVEPPSQGDDSADGTVPYTPTPVAVASPTAGEAPQSTPTSAPPTSVPPTSVPPTSAPPTSTLPLETVKPEVTREEATPAATLTPPPPAGGDATVQPSAEPLPTSAPPTPAPSVPPTSVPPVPTTEPPPATPIPIQTAAEPPPATAVPSPPPSEGEPTQRPEPQPLPAGAATAVTQGVPPVAAVVATNVVAPLAGRS